MATVTLHVDILIAVLSKIWVDDIYYLPYDAREIVTLNRINKLEEFYPGVLEGDMRSFYKMKNNYPAIQFLNTLPESNHFLIQIAIEAAKNGDIKTIYRNIHRKDFTFNMRLFNGIAASAAEGGYFDIVQWAVDKHGADNFNVVARRAARAGHIDIVRWAVGECGANNSDLIAWNAAQGGHIDIVKWLYITVELRIISRLHGVHI